MLVEEAGAKEFAADAAVVVLGEDGAVVLADPKVKEGGAFSLASPDVPNENIGGLLLSVVVAAEVAFEDAPKSAGVAGAALVDRTGLNPPNEGTAAVAAALAKDDAEVDAVAEVGLNPPSKGGADKAVEAAAGGLNPNKDEEGAAAEAAGAPGLAVSQHGHFVSSALFLTSQVGHFHLSSLGAAPQMDAVAAEDDPAAAVEEGVAAVLLAGAPKSAGVVTGLTATLADGGANPPKSGTATGVLVEPARAEEELPRVNIGAEEAVDVAKATGGNREGAAAVVDGVVAGGPKREGAEIFLAPGFAVSQHGHLSSSFLFRTSHVGHFHLSLLSVAAPQIDAPVPGTGASVALEVASEPFPVTDAPPNDGVNRPGVAAVFVSGCFSGSFDALSSLVPNPDPVGVQTGAVARIVAPVVTAANADGTVDVVV